MSKENHLIMSICTQMIEEVDKAYKIEENQVNSILVIDIKKEKIYRFSNNPGNHKRIMKIMENKLINILVLIKNTK